MPNYLLRLSPRDHGRAAALGLVSAGALLAFGALAIASARRTTAHADRAIGPRLAAKRGSRIRRVATAIGPIGKSTVFVPVGLGVALALARREGHPRRGAGAATVAAATIIAAVLEPTFDHILPQPPLPRGRSSKAHAVFPSGHAFVPSAVLLTSAYVLARQETLDARIGYPVAVLVPAVLAGAKLLAEKHWMSDVLAGWIAAVALAAGSGAVYELSGEN